jgi:hypothetical protein
MFCPKWTLSEHSSISTDDVIYGTLATVSCDEGFMFVEGGLVETIECSTDHGELPEALWNVDELQCVGEFYDRRARF